MAKMTPTKKGEKAKRSSISKIDDKNHCFKSCRSSISKQVKGPSNLTEGGIRCSVCLQAGGNFWHVYLWGCPQLQQFIDTQRPLPSTVCKACLKCTAYNESPKCHEGKIFRTAVICKKNWA
jgi:hypothetical protein